MGMPASELAERMTAVEFAEHVAEINLTIREQQDRQGR